MNPDSGKLHEIAEDLEGIERIAKGEASSDAESTDSPLVRAYKEGRGAKAYAREAADRRRPPEQRFVKSVEDELVRANSRLEAERARSTEPPPGTEVPPDWPRFELGERVGPIKGWWFELLDVDVEAQEILIRPLEPTKTTAERRKRKRTRCGTRRRRKRGFR